MSDSRIMVGQLVDRYLIALKMQAAPTTYDWYARYLHSFRCHVSGKRVMTLTSSSVYEWLDKVYGQHAPSSQNGAARAVVRLFNWGIEERLIPHSPLVRFQKPAATSREVLITEPQYAACLRAANPALKDAIKFIWHSGARPQELRQIESRWIERGKITFPALASKGTRARRKRRTIYLSGPAERVVNRLAQEHNRGPIFRNSNGGPWKKDGLALAFRRLAERVKIEGLCAYALRHAWITRLLERGVDVATVAKLAGNSPRMVLGVYSHVDQNEDRLRRLVG